VTSKKSDIERAWDAVAPFLDKGEFFPNKSLKAIASALKVEREKAEILVNALLKAKSQFDMYRRDHLLKGTDAGVEKASTNAACVLMCGDALSQWKNGQ
jgi:mRNA-degrading endonuclease YafQ of YafQ-DinJ toxin-antitoxin module